MPDFDVCTKKLNMEQEHEQEHEKNMYDYRRKIQNQDRVIKVQR